MGNKCLVIIILIEMDALWLEFPGKTHVAHTGKSFVLAFPEYTAFHPLKSARRLLAIPWPLLLPRTALASLCDFAACPDSEHFL